MIFEGIDERTIKCASDEAHTIQSGISFDTNNEEQPVLRFHFLSIDNIVGLNQITKLMVLNKENTKALINELKQLKFK
jgi:hypothetical protein